MLLQKSHRPQQEVASEGDAGLEPGETHRWIESEMICFWDPHGNRSEIAETPKKMHLQH